MKTFIVLTDFSKNATYASEYAVQLAQKRNAALQLVHIFEEPIPISESELATMHFHAMKDRILSELEERKKELIKKYGDRIPISCKIYEQPMIERIQEIFNPPQVKLILIGLTGSGMNNFFFGSNTLRIVQSSHCTILTVPPLTDFRPIRKLLFAFSSQDTLPSAVPINRLKKILAIFDVQLLVLQVDSSSPSYIEERNTDFDALFEDVPHQFFTVNQKNILVGIKEFIKKNEVDLITIIPQKSDFWETLIGSNHTKSMLFKSDIPILSIPEKE